jgi:hypothetical protein
MSGSSRLDSAHMAAEQTLPKSLWTTGTGHALPLRPVARPRSSHAGRGVHPPELWTAHVWPGAPRGAAAAPRARRGGSQPRKRVRKAGRGRSRRAPGRPRPVHKPGSCTAARQELRRGAAGGSGGRRGVPCIAGSGDAGRPNRERTTRERPVARPRRSHAGRGVHPPELWTAHVWPGAPRGAAAAPRARRGGSQPRKRVRKAGRGRSRRAPGRPRPVHKPGSCTAARQELRRGFLRSLATRT